MDNEKRTSKWLIIINCILLCICMLLISKIAEWESFDGLMLTKIIGTVSSYEESSEGVVLTIDIGPNIKQSVIIENSLIEKETEVKSIIEKKELGIMVSVYSEVPITTKLNPATFLYPVKYIGLIN